MPVQRALRTSAVLATIAAPVLAADGDVAGKVDVGGGRQMYLECRGAGSPTVLVLAPDTPPDIGYVTDRAQKVAQAELAALVPGARHVTKSDSGHDIHRDNPALVTEAIREVVDAVRAGSTALAP